MRSVNSCRQASDEGSAKGNAQGTIAARCRPDLAPPEPPSNCFAWPNVLFMIHTSPGEWMNPARLSEIPVVF